MSSAPIYLIRVARILYFGLIRYTFLVSFIGNTILRPKQYLTDFITTVLGDISTTENSEFIYTLTTT